MCLKKYYNYPHSLFDVYVLSQTNKRLYKYYRWVYGMPLEVSGNVCVGVERFHNYTLYAFISDSFVECLLIHRTCIVVVWSVESVRFPSQDEYLSWDWTPVTEWQIFVCKVDSAFTKRIYCFFCITSVISANACFKDIWLQITKFLTQEE